jgi:hypothetical protein
LILSDFLFQPEISIIAALALHWRLHSCTMEATRDIEEQPVTEPDREVLSVPDSRPNTRSYYALSSPS